MGSNDIYVNTYNIDQIASTDIEKTLFELNNEIGVLSSHADSIDYYMSIASRVICGMLDILWVGEFNLQRGRDFTNDEIEKIVKRIAKLQGCKEDDINGAVKFLENKYHIPSDGNINDFGGSLQHHFRDFAHHPTLAVFFFHY